MKKLVLIGFLAFLTNVFVLAQEERDLLDPKTRDILAKILDGDSAKGHVLQIAQYHRVQASPGYRSAANYVLEKLRSYGFSEKDAYIESFPSDGKVQYQTWQSPSGWDTQDAELSIVEPTPGKLQSFKETPMSLMTYSNPGDETEELVWVGAGTSDDDYKGKNVKGKFVLATGYGGEVHRFAVVKYGAKAVVCYLDDERAKEHPDMVQYTGIWPRTEELPKVTFGFNISYRQGTRLREMLESGQKVVLHGVVTGKGLHSYFMDVVVAHIRPVENLPTDELVFTAHLDHPKYSANDNASGAAAMLDIARALKNAIDNAQLPKPNRSFRFLWVPEWNGTMAYVNAHPELAGPDLHGRFLAGVNLDMVGENPELLHSRLYITRTPRSLPSCLNDVVENMANMVDRMDIRTRTGSRSLFNYRVTPYSGGSDHMMLIDRKIPAVMLSHSDWTHHTSEDTPEKVDPTELKRCELVATSTLWYLANLSTEQGLDLLELIRANGSRRLANIGRLIHPIIDTATIQGIAAAWGLVDLKITQQQQAEYNTAGSVQTFNGAIEIGNRLNQVRGNLGRRSEYLLEGSKSAAEAAGYAADAPDFMDDPPDSLVPVRLTRGPLDFRLPESKLPPTEAAWYQSKDFSLSGDERYEIINFIDEQRTVSDIHMVINAEFRPIPLQAISHYLRDLVKVGVLKWK